MRQFYLFFIKKLVNPIFTFKNYYCILNYKVNYVNDLFYYINWKESIMKKRLFTILAIFVLVFAFSVTCYAKKSPRGRVLPATEKNNKPNSPQGGSSKKNNDKKTNNDRGNGNKSTNNGSGSSNGYYGSDSATSPKTGYPMTGLFILTITAAGMAVLSREKIAK